MIEHHYIGIDNGVTGSVCVLDERGRLLFYGPTPVEKRQNYTKKKCMFNRVVGRQLAEILRPYAGSSSIALERPVTSARMGWNTIQSGLRCDEATIVVIEVLGMRYEYVDSRQWQKVMLPSLESPKKAPPGATAEEKKAIKLRNAQLKKQTKILSLEMGRRLFPETKFKGDADAALIAEWARRTKL